MIPGQTPQPRKRLDKSIFIILILLVLVIIAALGIICYMAGTKHASRYAVDFTIESFAKDEREPKYKFIPAELSNYICDMSEELESSKIDLTEHNKLIKQIEDITIPDVTELENSISNYDLYGSQIVKVSLYIRLVSIVILIINGN